MDLFVNHSYDSVNMPIHLQIIGIYQHTNVDTKKVSETFGNPAEMFCQV